MQIALRPSSLRLSLRNHRGISDTENYSDHTIESNYLEYIGDDWIEISDEAIFGDRNLSDKHKSSRNKNYINCIMNIHRCDAHNESKDEMNYIKIPLYPIKGPVLIISIYLNYDQFDYFLDCIRNKLYPDFFLFSLEAVYGNKLSVSEPDTTYFRQSNRFGPYEWDIHKSKTLRVIDFQISFDLDSENDEIITEKNRYVKQKSILNNISMEYYYIAFFISVIFFLFLLY